MTAEAPRLSRRSMASMTAPRFTMTLTLHQSGSSRLLIVGELKPGVICSAAFNLLRGTLYSNSE